MPPLSTDYASVDAAQAVELLEIQKHRDGPADLLQENRPHVANGLDDAFRGHGANVLALRGGLAPEAGVDINGHLHLRGPVTDRGGQRYDVHDARPLREYSLCSHNKGRSHAGLRPDRRP